MGCLTEKRGFVSDYTSVKSTVTQGTAAIMLNIYKEMNYWGH